MIVQETKLGPIGEALLAGKIRAQARRLREIEAGKATASPPDPLAALERREKARAERHMGSVVRRLHRQGKLGDRQLDALERWAADHAAATVGVRSQLGRDGGGPGNPSPDVDAKVARLAALSRYRVARVALYVGLRDRMDELWQEGVSYLEAARVTEAVACRNVSLTAAAGESGKSKGRAVCEAVEMLRAGADALDTHYRGRGAR